MNIQDVVDVPDSMQFLRDIFKTQEDLAIKYKDIEGIPDWPFDINNYEHQAWIKDFLWRSTEEVAEALEALELGHKEHYLEELSDALHFIVEALILAGVDSKHRFSNLEEMVNNIKGTITEKSTDHSINEGSLDYIKHLGLVGNTLKNKKWKKTQVLTDYNKFEHIANKSFTKLIVLFVISGCEAKDIYELYYKKSQVNKFRQNTNY